MRNDDGIGFTPRPLAPLAGWALFLIIVVALAITFAEQIPDTPPTDANLATSDTRGPY